MAEQFLSKNKETATLQPISASVRQFIKLSSFFIILVAISVLAGWQTDNISLKSILPAFSPMNPITALCFTLIGLLTLTYTLSQRGRIVNYVGCLAASIIGLVGIAMVVYYVTGYDIAVDRLLYEDKLAVNRMAPTTALAFIATSCAIISLFLNLAKVWLIRILAVFIFFISTFTLVAYAYGVQPIYGQAIYNPMALHTAILFLLVSLTTYAFTIRNFKIFISPAVIVLYLIATTLFLVLSTVTYRNFTDNFRASANVQEIYADKESVAALHISLVDAETGQRGYLLTGNKDFLEPYTTARVNVRSNLKEVTQVSDERITPIEKRQLVKLSEKRLELLNKTITQYDAGRSSVAISEVQSGAGNKLMDEIRKILRQIDTRTDSELTKRLEDSKKENQLTLLTLSFTSAAILVLLFVSLIMFQENLKRDSLKAIKAEKDIDAAKSNNEELEREVRTRTHDLEQAKDSLEKEVAERTSALNTELQLTQKMNTLMVDREIKMVELKDEIKNLKQK